MNQPNKFTIPYEYSASVDWRFWVELQPENRVLIVTETYDGFAAPLNLLYGAKLFTIEDSEQHSSQLRLGANHSEITRVRAKSSDLPFCSQSFDLIVVYGTWIEKLRFVALFDLLKPGGFFVIGFYNKLNFLKPHKSGTLTYQNARSIFKQASFTNIYFLGAFPDHRIPVMLFPLTSKLCRAALKRYYGHKIPVFFLHILSTPVLMPLTSRMLPAYILIAS